MITARPAVDAVILGGGWTGSVIGKKLAAAGLRVVMLERGEARKTSPDYQSPQNWQSASRKNDDEGVMRMIAHGLTDEMIRSLATCYTSVR